MRSLVSLQDFLFAGLGLDIAGAFLLARGLLGSAERMLAAAGTYLGYNTHFLAERAWDRVEATFGLTSLGAGFLLQLVTYVLTIARGPEGSPTGWGPGAVGLGIAAMGGAAVLSIAAT